MMHKQPIQIRAAGLLCAMAITMLQCFAQIDEHDSVVISSTVDIAGHLIVDDIRPHVSPSNLVLHLSCDEMTEEGLLHDQSGKANDATTFGCTFNSTAWANGGVDVDNGATIEIGDDDTLDPGTGDFTMSGWVKLSASGGGQHYHDWYLFNKYDGNTPGYFLDILPDWNGGLVGIAIRMDGNSYGAWGNTAICDGQWHHLAAVVDRDSMMTLYVDGQVDAMCDISLFAGGNIDNNLPLKVVSTTNYEHKGQVDEISLFRRALTADEILSMASLGPLQKISSVIVRSSIRSTVSPMNANDLTTKAYVDSIYATVVASLKGPPTSDTLEALISEVSSERTRILINGGTWILNNDITIPGNIHLTFAPNSMLSASGPIALTLNGTIDDTPHQIFGPNVSVTGLTRMEFIRPEWWGAISDDALDDHAALTAALETAIRVPIRLSAGEYVFFDHINLTSEQTLSGTGMNATTLRVADNVDLFWSHLITSSPGTQTHGITVQDLTIDCNHENQPTTEVEGSAVVAETRAAINLGGYGMLIDRVRAKNFGVGANALECFPLMTIADWVDPSIYPDLHGRNIIRDCEVTDMPNHSLMSHSQGISFLSGISSAWVDGTQFPASNIESSIIGCRVYNINAEAFPYAKAFGGTLVERCSISGCNGVGFSGWDLGDIHGMVLRNNHCAGVPYFMQIVPGNPESGTSSTMSYLELSGNHIQLESPVGGEAVGIYACPTVALNTPTMPRMVIRDNHFTAATSTATDCVAIRLTSASTAAATAYRPVLCFDNIVDLPGQDEPLKAREVIAQFLVWTAGNLDSAGAEVPFRLKNAITGSTRIAEHLKRYASIATDMITANSQDLGTDLYFPCDKLVNGNIRDESGNEHSGTVTGGTLETQGKFGSSLAISDIGQVSVDSSTALNLGLSDLTISLWIKPVAVPPGNQNEIWFLFEKCDSLAADSGYFLYLNPWTGIPVAGARANGTTYQNDYAAQTKAICDGTWHHVVAVFDRDTAVTIYVDGTLQQSSDISPLAAVSVANNHAVTIASGKFEGQVDEVSLTRRVLVEHEIVRLFSIGPASSMGTVRILSAMTVEGAVSVEGNLTANDIVAAGDLRTSAGRIKDKTGFVMPVGTILAYGGTSAPEGWLLCDGASVLRTGDYTDLFAAIGTAYGTADGTHFNVPDLQGRFVRGADNGAGNDPDAASRTAVATGGNTGDNVGSAQDDVFKSHDHSCNEKGVTSPWIIEDHHNGLHPLVGFSGAVWLGSTINRHVHDIGNTGGNETRPANVSVNYIIKY